MIETEANNEEAVKEDEAMKENESAKEDEAVKDEPKKEASKSPRHIPEGGADDPFGEVRGKRRRDYVPMTIGWGV